jgi:phospholipase D1/2
VPHQGNNLSFPYLPLQSFTHLQVIDGDLNPTWDEKFEVRTTEDIHTIKVEVFDKDVGSKSSLGYILVRGDDIGSSVEGGDLSGTKHGAIDFSINIEEQASKMLNAHIRSANDLHDGDYLGVSDPYAAIYLNGEEVAKTQVVENNLNPVWDEKFDIPYVDEIETLRIEVFDWDKEHDDTLTSLGFVEFKPYQCKGTIHGGPMSNNKAGSILSTIDFDIVIDCRSHDFGVPQPTSFITRENCSVHLYQDAHSDPTLPQIVNGEGEEFGYTAGDCWVDVYNALDKAQKFIYLTGWSIDTKISLKRDLRAGAEKDETIGELLTRKVSEGCTVCVHVWDEATSFEKGKQDGMMGTHDEETVRVLNEGGVHAIKSFRDGHSSFLFTHHQKTIIYDADPYDGGDARRIGAFVGGLDLCDGRWDTPKHTLFTTLAYEHKLDFHNPWLTVSQQVGPREPWHDIHSKLDGAVARDVLTNFEERWRKQAPEDKKGCLAGTSEDHGFIDEGAEHGNLAGADKWTVQLFRSIDSYSCTVDGVQRSIQDAYINAIRAAEHFIYIENQYFLGSCMYWDQNRKAGCINTVPYEIAMKVCEKIRQKRRFAAYILIPMYPEGVPASGAVQEVLLWQFRTQTFMYKMVHETIEDVYKGSSNKPHVFDYLNFYCVGTRETGEGSEAEFLNVDDFEAKTELDELLAKTKRFAIYVHSKMMIVDDYYAIVGSANINERSMSGDRDSEIAMGGFQPASMTEFGGRGEVHKFRLNCWAEHTRSADPIFENPSSIHAVRKMNEIGKQNWETFTSDEVVDMPSHLLKYPISVEDGKVISEATIPDTDAPIQGDGSLVLVNILTT